VAEAGDEVVAEPVAKSARKLKYEHLMQDDGKYHCGDCTFTTASHQGIATHVSRSHKAVCMWVKSTTAVNANSRLQVTKDSPRT
jgi:hypothetical protein